MRICFKAVYAMVRSQVTENHNLYIGAVNLWSRTRYGADTRLVHRLWALGATDCFVEIIVFVKRMVCFVERIEQAAGEHDLERGNDGRGGVGVDGEGSEERRDIVVESDGGLGALGAGEISEGHARALLGLATAPEQVAALEWVLEKGLSVRQTEELVRRWAAGETPPAARSTAETTPEGDRDAVLRQAFIDGLQRALGQVRQVPVGQRLLKTLLLHLARQLAAPQAGTDQLL